MSIDHWLATFTKDTFQGSASGRPVKAARTAASMRSRSSLRQPAIMMFKLMVTLYFVPPRWPGTDVGVFGFLGKTLHSTK